MISDIEKQNLLSDFCKFYCKSDYDCKYCLVEEFLNYIEIKENNE
jgi:hypothetical protein